MTKSEYLKEWRRRNPGKQRQYSSKFYSRAENREKLKQYGESYYERNKEKILKQSRTRQLKNWYGLTEEQYNDLRASQDDCCAICSAKLSELPPKHVHVDHCHDTGKVRGILCFNCNNGLGAFKDNQEVVSKALSYLERSVV